MSAEKRWAVVTVAGAVVYEMYRKENAEEEAAILNEGGTEECKPYRVIEVQS